MIQNRFPWGIFAIAVVIVVSWLAFTAGMIYAAIHFICKYW